MHQENDELKALKLDEVFKENLALIRPHVLNIQSIADANLCRLWLEKLSSCSTQEREIRNAYISELRCQVEAGRLQAPFSSPPIDGALVTYIPTIGREFGNFTTSSWSDVTETTICRLKRKCEDGNSSSTEDCVSVVSIQNKCHMHCIKMQQQYEERLAAQEAVLTRYKQALSLFLKNHNPDDNSSQKIEVIQNIYEKKISTLKAEIKDLKEENKNLHEEMIDLRKIKADKNDWNLLLDDIKSLKIKLDDAYNSKKSLENCHKKVVLCYQQEFADAINQLSYCVNEAQFKNKSMELQLHIALDQLEKLSHKINQEAMVPATERYKCIDERKEDSYCSKSQITLQNEEVKHLEALLKEQCYRIQEEVNCIKNDLKLVSEKREKHFRAQVNELEKTVDKYSRMKGKLLKKYNLKLCSLQKEKHVEVKGLELQLFTQKAEIIACLNNDRQKELEVIVNKLEERYKDMLTDVEKKFCRRHEEDQMRISHLEAELSYIKNNFTATFPSQ